MDVIKNEPVLIQSAVQVILGLFLAFGLSLSDEQVGSIMAVTAVILALLARVFVTPTNKLGTTVGPPEAPPAAPLNET
jgi:outer membrane biosynthesis protein TonB